MPLRITEDNEYANSEVLLNGLAMEPNTESIKAFLVTKIVEGKSTLGAKFFRFYIKDVNGLTYIARQFNAIEGNPFKYTNKICVSSMIAEENSDGSKEFILNDIRVLDTTEMHGLDNSVFVGVCKERASALTQVKNLLNNVITGTPYEVCLKVLDKTGIIDKISNSPYEGVEGDRIGGAIVYINKAIKTICAIEDDKDRVASASILLLLSEGVRIKASSENPNSILSDFTRGTKILEVYIKTIAEYGKDLGEDFWNNFREDCLHTWETLSGLKQPQTLSAITVNIASKSALEYLRFSFITNNLEKGSTVAYCGKQYTRLI